MQHFFLLVVFKSQATTLFSYRIVVPDTPAQHPQQPIYSAELKKKNMEITHKTSLVPTILKTVPKSDDSDGLTSSYEKEKEQLGKYFINSSGGKSLKNAQPVAPLLLAHTKKI